MSFDNRDFRARMMLNGVQKVRLLKGLKRQGSKKGFKLASKASTIIKP